MTPDPSRPRFKLLIVGVGGQGVLTASKLLGDAAFRGGLKVSVGQLHGMAQRGGSVECSVLIGPGRSSWISDHSADTLLGLEPLEVLRAAQKISHQTKIVLNLARMVPLSLAVKGETYPPMETLVSRIRDTTPHLHLVDGPALVKETGVPRTLNVVMLGALAGLNILPFDADHLWASIEKMSPRAFLAPNKMAYELGRQAVEQSELTGPPSPTADSGPAAK